MTVTEIARVAGVSHMTVHRWRQRGNLQPIEGKRPGLLHAAPYRFNLTNVADYLGMSEEEIRRRLAEIRQQA